MTVFDAAFAQTVGNEGGYSNDPRDPGGETMWGITVAVARGNGYAGPMRDMPLNVAKTIYRHQYWDTLRCDDLPPSVADDLFDMAVNHGVGAAARALQGVLGVPPDGNIGPITIAAAKLRSADKIVLGLTSLRITRYTMDRNWGAFGKGWANRAARMLWLQSQEATV